MALWRDKPFVDVPSPRLQQEESAWLNELRVEALELWMQAAMNLRRYEWAVTQLGGLIRAYPLRERLHQHLIVALDRLGRRADALVAYQRVRRILADELGIDPGAELQVVHQRILTADGVESVAGDNARAGGAEAETAAAELPRQLPPRIRHFVGRQLELDELADLLATAQQTGTHTPVLAISGPPGVGKTALAVHWGHQVAAHFPDGQLYLDLRGFHPSGNPVTPDDAIRDLLSGLLPGDAALPVSSAARASLYRSVVADKRLLIVLDNAYNSEQVRRLLPGGSCCLTIVTSRNRLNGLVAMEDAHPVVLGLLPDSDAYSMLVRRLGRGRLEREPTATRHILELCQRLPLALSVVAARGATCPQLSLSALTDEMREVGNALDRFRADPDSPDVRAVFSWSYRQLTESAAKMFRLIGLYPATTISSVVAASLASLPVEKGREALLELASAHLLTAQDGDRFTCHDLMHSYAGELAAQQPAEETAAPLERMLDYYLHTGHRAAALLEPIRQPLRMAAPAAGTQLTALADDHAARAWFRAEITQLIVCVRLAAEHGYDTRCWQLAWTLVDYLHSEGRHEDLLNTQRTALSAARRTGDLDGEARVHREVSRANQLFERTEEDCPHLTRALHLYRQNDDIESQGRTHLGIAYRYARQGRHVEARDSSRQALELARRSGDKGGRAASLNALGWCHAELGDYDSAMTCCEESLELHRELGMRVGEAYSRDSLGYISSALGDLDGAIANFSAAIELWKALGNRVEWAMTLRRLADAMSRHGDSASGESARKLADKILDGMGQIGVHLP
jgi:tetratricopeptide (TPR) repeat protein